MCIERTLISLNPHKHVDNSEASQLQQNNVNAVLQEADDPSYWVSASKDGNRESHYRGEQHICLATCRNTEHVAASLTLNCSITILLLADAKIAAASVCKQMRHRHEACMSSHCPVLFVVKSLFISSTVQ